MRKTDKAQQVTPQAKSRHSNKLNRILNTSSSKDKPSDTIEGSDNVKSMAAKEPAKNSGSKSLTFPEPFSVPKQETEKKILDTELFTDDEDNEIEKIQPKPKSPVLQRKPASDTLIGNTEEIEAYRETHPSESDEEVIAIYDSDEESSLNRLSPPKRNSQYYMNMSSSTNSDFFNRPPSLSSHLAFGFMDINGGRRLKSPPIRYIGCSESESADENETKMSVEREQFGDEFDDIEIGPTDESNNVEDAEEVIDLTINDNEPTPPPIKVKETRSKETIVSSNTPNTIKAQISTPRSGKKNVTNIQIKFDVKISIREGGASDISSSESEKSTPPATPRRITETTSTTSSKSENIHSNKQAGTPNPMLQMIKDKEEEPKTPEKEELVIDEDLQQMLNAVYGESWKTPQLLRSCKSKRVRESLRKSLHANNFESFVQNLPSDLESTRVNMADSDEKPKKSDVDETFRKPIAPISAKKTASIKKTPKARTPSVSSDSDVQSTPKSQKSIPRSGSKATPTATPKYLEICDPETSSDEDPDDDDEYNPNDTWNASSDEDYESESERIKKRNIVRQSMRFEEELTFVRDESIEEQQKIDLLLEKYEYTKPPQVGEIKKKSKRKLFTHSHYEDEEENEISTQKTEEKENQIPKDFKWPSPPRKDIKKPEILTPVVRKTPAKTQTPKQTPKTYAKELQKRFGPLSFLKSLDAEANRSLCDADALHYRNNYKSKKHELAEKLFKLYNEKVFRSELSNVPIKWNKKLLNTAGRCNNSRRNGVRQSALELSDKVLTSADRLRCTLIHEMCHAAAWLFDGENGHGVAWKRWTAKANSTFPELPKISVCHDYVIEYRYTYLCINCKAQSKTHSKSRKVEEIQCSICKGSIKLFENKKNSAGQIEMVPVEKKEIKGKKKYQIENYNEKT